MVKTSDSHPIQIGAVTVPIVGAKIGMTFCPGKKGPGLYSGNWDRNLQKDLSAIIEWGAAALVTLVEEHEFSELHVPEFGQAVVASGLEWFHLPIVDGGIPDDGFVRALQGCRGRITEILCKG